MEKRDEYEELKKKKFELLKKIEEEKEKIIQNVKVLLKIIDSKNKNQLNNN